MPMFLETKMNQVLTLFIKLFLIEWQYEMTFYFLFSHKDHKDKKDGKNI